MPKKKDKEAAGGSSGGGSSAGGAGSSAAGVAVEAMEVRHILMEKHSQALKVNGQQWGPMGKGPRFADTVVERWIGYKEIC